MIAGTLRSFIIISCSRRASKGFEGEEGFTEKNTPFQHLFLTGIY